MSVPAMSRNETGCCYHRKMSARPPMRAQAMGLGFSAGKASDPTPSRDKLPSGSGASVGAAIEIIYPHI